ncbi:MAG: Gp49 family protein, partial [Sarcina sp.]
KSNYDELIGEQECMKKIKDELWKLEGYHLANLIADKKLQNLSFGEAVERLKDGEWISRKGWNGKGMYLSLQMPTDKSKMTRPYIYMKTADDMLVPWVASQSDILCDDWYVFNIKSVQVRPSYIVASVESGTGIASSKGKAGVITQTLENKKVPYAPVSSDIRKW